ncbi:hypothetical protein [Motiliproteus sp. MSK22-1]|uniref:hypothetical protein n=1 Tax=Motiliproteus sp. MSK22-1 TaxID=1897630 RepID=UPI0009762862|nr:hypothetical protein [Motiliproteus sp. MSK22-1]OMH38271.1 hypothetical protein BGP75_08475 [Motiliproteus sp. MSK22-1]
MRINSTETGHVRGIRKWLICVSLLFGSVYMSVVEAAQPPVIQNKIAEDPQPVAVIDHTQPVEPGWEVVLPPDSLAKWYKPQNKRQVWLHSMFKLRQAMQAIDYYLQQNDPALVRKWADTLQSTYAKLPEMVPEWRDASRQHISVSLHEAAQNGNLEKVADQRQRLQKFCDACHQQWQPLVTAIYRSPDYARVMVSDSATGESLSYPKMMQKISTTLGLLKLKREDGFIEEARKTTEILELELQDLAVSCSNCHRDEASTERILGADLVAEFQSLRQTLVEPHDPKASGKHLGAIGFTVCGRCHSIHRTLGDLRKWMLSPES